MVNEKLVEILSQIQECGVHYDTANRVTVYTGNIGVAQQLIDEGVTIQKHGKWLINSDGYYPYCSNCKEEPKHGEMTPYCPNCGADMRERKDNAK